MKRIKKVFLVVHIVLWILFGLLIALQLSQSEPYWRRLTIGVLTTTLFTFYCHFFLLTSYSGKKKKSAYYQKLAGIILAAPLIYLFLHYKKPDTFFEEYVIILFSIVLPFIFLSWLARVTENLVINTFKKEQLEKQAVESELYYLKSQINPHFLFNTLNNIHTLVYKQAPAAPDAVMHLASLMRYMIYESNAPLVPLNREIEYLKDYISLQQLRYKQSPVVDLQITGQTEFCEIAPLLFIHLIENAYKHSPARLNPGDIKVTVKVEKDILTFSVQNPVSRNQTDAIDEHDGIGLPNVKKRLALLYHGQHTLEIHSKKETFAVILKIEGLQSKPHERKAHLLYN